MSLNILKRINHGYDYLEPIILGLMAMNHNFMLIGKHGTGKTRLARVLSKGYSEEGFVFYDATKDDLISIAGIPDPEAIKEGKLRFIPHERTIWNKSTIVVDEITRAAKENQNLWLEIIEQKTCFGLPLTYRTLIATANPESYAAAFQLDEALLDRFYAVIPVPEMQKKIHSKDVQSMIMLATEQNVDLEAEEIARIFVEIQKAHASLMKKNAMKRISVYLGSIVPSLLKAVLDQEDIYLSPRTYSRNLPLTILDVAAYFEVINAEDALCSAAQIGLRYAVATKLQIKPIILEQLHQSAKDLLKEKKLSASNSLRFKLTSINNFEERLKFIEENWDKIKRDFKGDEIEKLLGELLKGATKKGEKEKLVILKETLLKLGYKGEALRQVDGRLLITLNSAINNFLPKISIIINEPKLKKKYPNAQHNIKIFENLIQKGLFLGNSKKEILKLKSYLIDLYEGDVSSDPESICSFFDKLDLKEF